MENGVKLSVRIISTVLLLAALSVLTFSRYFYNVTLQSEFLWLSLASTSIIHLRIRPRWTEAALLAAATCLISSIAFSVLKFPPGLMLLCAYLGIASLALLGTRSIWSEGEERKLLLWGFVPGVLFVGFGWLTPPLLLYGETAHPKVLDLYLYSFDCSLRFQPSFLLGVAFLRVPLLRAISYFFYLGLSIPIALVYVEQLLRSRKAALPVMLALLYCGPIGAIFYGIFPALGPVHLFQTDFPLHPLAISDAKRLFLEPIVLKGFRNAIPSLHMTWVLLTWWYSYGQRWWSKAIMLAFLLFTILATLGSGEHYLIDLVVAFPFAVMIQGIFAFSIPWKSPDRFSAILGSLAIVLVWLALLRFENHFFWRSPVIPWALIIVTVSVSFFQQRRLRSVVQLCLSKDSVSDSPPAAIPAIS
jgi:hypothetical protein